VISFFFRDIVSRYINDWCFEVFFIQTRWILNFNTLYSVICVSFLFYFFDLVQYNHFKKCLFYLSNYYFKIKWYYYMKVDKTLHIFFCENPKKKVHWSKPAIIPNYMSCTSGPLKYNKLLLSIFICTNNIDSFRQYESTRIFDSINL